MSEVGINSQSAFDHAILRNKKTNQTITAEQFDNKMRKYNYPIGAATGVVVGSLLGYSDAKGASKKVIAKSVGKQAALWGALFTGLVAATESMNKFDKKIGFSRPEHYQQAYKNRGYEFEGYDDPKYEQKHSKMEKIISAVGFVVGGVIGVAQALTSKPLSEVKPSTKSKVINAAGKGVFGGLLMAGTADYLYHYVNYKNGNK